MGRVWTRDEFCEVFKIGGADFDAMVAEGPAGAFDGRRLDQDYQRLRSMSSWNSRRGREAVTLEHYPMSSHPEISPLIAQVGRIADALDPPPPDVVGTRLRRRFGWG